MLFGKKPKPIRAESLALIQASKDGPATFEARPAYSGGVLRVAGYRFGVVIDLAGLSVNKKVLANLDHDSKKRIGHITDHTNDGKSLSLSGVMSADTESAREVLASHDRGFPWDCSIEAIPTVRTEMVEAGKTVFVNGQSFSGPLEVARKSTLYGLGFVSLGADSENQVAIAAEEVPLEDTEQTFESWAMSHEFDLSSMSEQELAVLQSIYDKQSKASEPIAASFDANFIRAEVDKSYRSIEAVLLKYEDTVKPEKLAEIKAEAQDKIRALKSKAGEHEYTGVKFQFEATPIIAQTHLACIRATYPQGPTIHSSTRDLQMDQKTIEASLLLRTGREVLAVKSYGERACEAASKANLTSLVDVCKAAIHASMRDIPTGGNEAIIKAAFSNTDLPNILSNVTGKTLVEAYQETTSSWRLLAAIKPAANFKEQKGTRPSSIENLAELGAAGEIKHGVLSEEGNYPWSISTFARMLGVTRKDIINDDLGFFDTISPALGTAAGRTLNDTFWEVWMTGAGSFWHANNANLTTTGSALSITGLAKGILLMRKQVDKNGNSIEVNPVSLVVPPELELTARPLINSSTLVGGSTAGPVDNPMFGVVKNLIVEPRLSNTSFTNNSLTAWYLNGPIAAESIIVGFLNGMQSPTIEIEQADFNKLGVQMRVVFDFGVALADPRGAVKATGAS